MASAPSLAQREAKASPSSAPMVPRAPNGAGGTAASTMRRLNQKKRKSAPIRDRKSVVKGQSVSVRVDPGGLLFIQKKTYTIKYTQHPNPTIVYPHATNTTSHPTNPQ